MLEAALREAHFHPSGRSWEHTEATRWQTGWIAATVIPRTSLISVKMDTDHSVQSVSWPSPFYFANILYAVLRILVGALGNTRMQQGGKPVELLQQPVFDIASFEKIR